MLVRGSRQSILSILTIPASGDIRNVVESVAGLPVSPCQCHIVINDRVFDIVARNAILLLVALHFETTEAISTMIHMRYSAFIPPNMYQRLREVILPLIHDVCNKIKDKPDKSLQAKTWKKGSTRV